jgi:hypothetical protein
MAIDHGLQGKNSENSRRKRAAKARKTKAIAQAAMTKDRKVLFNESSRVEWLTGFRKRKQLRRQYGVAMQILKDKKSLKVKSQEKRKAESGKPSFHLPMDEDQADGMDHPSEEEDEEDKQSIIFNDEQTTNLFGSSVAVEINSNIGEKLRLDPWAINDEIASIASASSKRNQPSTHQQEFNNAIKKAKHILGNRKAKKRKEKKGLQLKAKLSGKELGSHIKKKR